ncbi:hypothetical protein B0H14DRAFT_2684517 [Mycena olivaceomarginata]|nr:hypothetical protein B0H14DRAFT_2684517 [Mycena olivaceomarginata]
MKGVCKGIALATVGLTTLAGGTAMFILGILALIAIQPFRERSVAAGVCLIIFTSAVEILGVLLLIWGFAVPHSAKGISSV